MTDEQAQLYALLDLVDGFVLELIRKPHPKWQTPVCGKYAGQGLFVLHSNTFEILTMSYNDQRVFEAPLLWSPNNQFIGDAAPRVKIHLGERLTTKLLRAAYKALNVAPPT